MSKEAKYLQKAAEIMDSFQGELPRTPNQEGEVRKESFLIGFIQTIILRMADEKKIKMPYTIRWEVVIGAYSVGKMETLQEHLAAALRYGESLFGEEFLETLKKELSRTPRLGGKRLNSPSS